MCLFDQTGLKKQERITGSRVRSAVEETRTLSLRQRRHHLQLINSNPHYLSAVNPSARITWGKLLCEKFSDHFHLGRNRPEPDRPMFLVTLCHRRCCTSHQENNVGISRFIRILRRGLRGLSYL